jgi:hypothetical protein
MESLFFGTFFGWSGGGGGNRAPLCYTIALTLLGRVMMKIWQWAWRGKGEGGKVRKRGRTNVVQSVNFFEKGFFRKKKKRRSQSRPVIFLADPRLHCSHSDIAIGSAD